MIRFLLALVLLATPLAAASSSGIEIELSHTEYWEKPQEVVVIPAKVTNQGSVPTRVVFEIASNPSDLAAPVPAPVSIEAGATKDVLFTVMTPYRFGHMDQVAAIVYRAIPAGGDPQEFEVKVGTKGFYVPGPQIFGVMLAVGMAALFFGRRAR